MNVLTDVFPTTVEINNREYELNTDFRTGIDIMLAYEDSALTAADKVAVMLNLLYKEMPPDLGKAVDLAVLFLDCGEDRAAGQDAEPAKRLYSFEKDAKYIYSAIRQTHGIDLETIDYLHWWKFCYLLLDLNEDCFFQQIISLRRRKQEGKLSKEERIAYYRMEDIMALPQEKDAEQRQAEDAFMQNLRL